jgi:DNA-binding transcriptional MocR family regulator
MSFRNAGCFLWLNLSPFVSAMADKGGWSAEEELRGKLLDAGVLISTGSAYKFQRPGWFRVIFTLEKDVLEEGLRRCVECWEAKRARI